MLAKVIAAGDKAEVLKWDNTSGEEKAPSVLVSKVLETPEENTLKIAMPMSKTHTIPLRVGEVYDMRFYTQTGTYSCTGRVSGRYMENSIGVLVIEIFSTLEKVQRRQFFRVECIVDIQLHVLSVEELQELESYDQQKKAEPMDGAELMMAKIGSRKEVWEQGIITDISGGGARFTTRSPLPEESTLFLSIELEQKNEIKEHQVFARLIASTEVEKRPGFYENRVQFIHLKAAEREEIIRFVFDEDRKRLKRERGNVT